MELFVEAYNRDTYLNFLAKKFNLKKFIQTIKKDNSEVESFEQLGTVTTKDSKTLPVFEIHIKPNSRLSRNRVQLRNLVAKQIQTEDGALAVYVDKENEQWRFSFIAIEYHLTADGLTKTQTASKRFTYLLGKNTQTRTANERFEKINKSSTLDDLKEAFAVEPLNKEFYDKLYRWYEKAQGQVTFPNDEQAENHTQTSLIRLLTRLLFIWFIKEKKLINADLFDKGKLPTLIDYDQPSSFYKAILQNLFFATLSTEIKKRDFRKASEFQGKNKDYGNQYRYRYHALVKDEKEWKSLFSQTPFLNGGLFESLDRKLDEKNADDKKLIDEWDEKTRPEKTMIRMDGFSENSKNPLSIENNLFFNDEDSGLIDLFNQYQFTVEESTPLDVEVALDPELLGKVFENLLASYNPETGQQARKATGSFYTPREIVSYMVDESLKAYLTQKVPPHDGEIKFYTDRLQDLISLSDKTGELPAQEDVLIYPEEIPQLIKAISQIKILDPAVGSGAFPMGLLQRMVALLAILDPNNKQWQQQKLDELPDLKSIEQDLKTSEKINNTQAKQQAQQILSDKKQQIINDFKQLDHNYLRKLYLIENCIYGVDIQPVAILIAQLRFFISLAIEQMPNSDKNKNFGIQPLPNLDYHFEMGNSLIGLPNNYHPDRVKELLREIGQLKHQVFSENDHKKKSNIKRQIKEKTDQCYNKIQKAIGCLIDFDYKINFSEVFDSHNGFDIVIGNPPYIRQEKIKEFKQQFSQSFSVFTGTADIYTYFYEKGVQLLNNNGHLCYITSNKWMRAKYGEKLRCFFKHQSQLKQIIDFEGEQIFENATVDTSILLCGKTPNTQINFEYQKQLPDDTNPLFNMAIEDLSTNAYTLQASEILALKKKIEHIGTPLKEWDISIYRGVLTGFNEAFIIDTSKRDELIAQDPKSTDIIKPILRGRDIQRYEHHRAEKWIIATFPVLKINIDNYPAIKNHLISFGKDRLAQVGKKLPDGTISRKKTGNKWFETQDQIGYHAEFEKEKIVYNDIAKKLSFSLSESGEYLNNTVYFIADNNNLLFQLAILNSNLIDWYYKQISAQLGSGVVRMFSIYVKQLPIPKISKTEQQPFIDCVNEILTTKKSGKDTIALETKIDKMVYQLYNLTADEIKIIEGESG